MVKDRSSSIGGLSVNGRLKALIINSNDIGVRKL